MEFERFLNFLHEKKIICFGAGEGIYGFFDLLREYQLERYVDFAVDNSKLKHGKIIKLNSKKINVYSLEDMYSMISSNHVVLVTCKYYGDISSQLNGKFNDIPIINYKEIFDSYITSLMQSINILDDLKQSELPEIPKIIHFCWFGRKPIPSKCMKWMKSWKKFFHDYEIIKWDESNYDITKNSYMKDAYQEGNFGLVSDYARLDIIYTYGGIYLDVDVEIIKSWDDLLYNDGFAGMQVDGKINLGLGFGAKKGLEIVRIMRDDYDKQTVKNFHTIEEMWEKNCKLCTDIQTGTLSKYGFVQDGSLLQKIKGLTIYPIPVLNPKIGERFFITKNTYSIHHFEGTWL